MGTVRSAYSGGNMGPTFHTGTIDYNMHWETLLVSLCWDQMYRPNRNYACQLYTGIMGAGILWTH